MPPGVMRASTPALLRMTEESPTALATSPSQVRDHVHMYALMLGVMCYKLMQHALLCLK